MSTGRNTILIIGSAVVAVAAVAFLYSSTSKKDRVEFGITGNWSSNCVPLNGVIFGSIQSDLSFSVEDHFEKVEKLFKDTACLDNVVLYKVSGSFSAVEDVLSNKKYTVSFAVAESSVNVVNAEALSYFKKIDACDLLSWQESIEINILNLKCAGWRNKSGQIVEAKFSVSKKGLSLSDNLWLPSRIYLEDGAKVEKREVIYKRL